MRIFLSLFLCTSLLLISGCQSLSQTHSDSSERIQLESKSISRITDKADIEITLNSDSSIIETQHRHGLEYMPYMVYVPKLAVGTKVKAKVRVTLNGTELMHGEAPLHAQAVNRIELLPSFEKTLGNTYWMAEDISGRGIPPYVKTTLAMSENGTLKGFAGCNRFKGNYKSAAVLLEFDQVVTTRQKCSNPVMFHETRFLNYLKDVEYFKVESGKLLLFTHGHEKPIVFSAADAQSFQLSFLKR